MPFYVLGFLLLTTSSCNGERNIDCEYFEDCETPSTKKSRAAIMLGSNILGGSAAVYLNGNYVGAANTPAQYNFNCSTQGALVIDLIEGQYYQVYGTYSGLQSGTFSFYAAANTCHTIELVF